eukprot:GEMP01037112.1.p1 GENE.GEMP01037112.1~~GEMP01037112.1.p1  ORF type:complete len:403 (+),score=93.32 GEMP01037112.1:236-1444(+)
MRAFRILGPLGLASTHVFCGRAEKESNGPARFESLDRVRGNYENRIKFFSNPEKIFEYFATTTDKDGAPVMSQKDFMNSLVPHTFKPEYLIVPEWVYNKVLLLADLDGDGLISFAEFLFFTSLITISRSDLTIAFNIFCDKGNLSYEGFCDMMVALLKHSSHGGRYCQLTRFDPRGVATSLTIEQIVEQSAIALYFFGNNPETSKKTINFRAVEKLFARLKEDVLYFEFARHSSRCPTELAARKKERAAATITAKQMGTLMSGYINPNDIETYANNVEKMDWSDVEDITFAEVRLFDSLTNDVQKLSTAIDFMMLKGIMLDRHGLAYLIEHISQNGRLADGAEERSHLRVKALVEIIFRVFDANGNGVLSDEEFLQTLKIRRDRTGMGLGPLFHKIRQWMSL